MIQIGWTALQTSNPFPQTNTPVVRRYHAKLAFMIAGIHHHPRSLNLFLVFLSVNVGVFFSFFRSELANRFFLCMAFARYSSLFHLHSVI